VEQHAEDEEQEDDDVEVQVEPFLDEVVDQVNDSERREDEVDDVAVVDPLGQCRAGGPLDLDGLAQQLLRPFRRQADGILFFRMHEVEEERDGEQHDRNGDHVPRGQDRIGDRNDLAGDLLNQVQVGLVRCQKQGDGA